MNWIGLLKFSLLLFCASAQKTDVQDLNLTFPDGFLIGTATSAYQVEGAWNVSGKSESIWDHLAHKHPESIGDANGDVTTDFYHKYREDIQLVKNTGFHFFRFSISWARLFPTGYANKPNKDGVRFYHDILDELERQRITPFITIYHWDHPQVLEETLDGWLNESMAYVFADVARFVFKEYGGKVKFFSTINEPTVFCDYGYANKYFYKGNNLNETAYYLCLHNTLKAHALAYHIYNKEFRSKQNGQVGIVVPCFYYYTSNKSDTASRDIAIEFNYGSVANPIFSSTGDYPEVFKRKVDERSKLLGLSKSKLPVFTKEWIDKLKGSSDYFGLNHYSSYTIEPLPQADILNWPNDEGLSYSSSPEYPATQSLWLKVIPHGLRDVLRSIKSKYNNPPVYILENGMSDGSGTDDYKRINYFHSYLKELLKAIKEDNCNVKAWTVWSLLDSYEWYIGFAEQFGVIHVDFNDENRKRTPKKSLSWLKSVIQSHKLQPLIDSN